MIRQSLDAHFDLRRCRPSRATALPHCSTATPSARTPHDRSTMAGDRIACASRSAVTTLCIIPDSNGNMARLPVLPSCRRLGRLLRGLGVCSHDEKVLERRLLSHVSWTLSPITGSTLLRGALSRVVVASTDRRRAFTPPPVRLKILTGRLTARR